jgi:hypothetical protein
MTEYVNMKNRIDYIIANNGLNKAVELLIKEHLCSSKADAKILYYQNKGKKTNTTKHA